MGLIFYLKAFRNVLEYENLRNNLVHIVQRKGVSASTQHLKLPIGAEPEMVLVLATGRSSPGTDFRPTDLPVDQSVAGLHSKKIGTLGNSIRVSEFVTI